MVVCPSQISLLIMINDARAWIIAVSTTVRRFDVSKVIYEKDGHIGRMTLNRPDMRVHARTLAYTIGYMPTAMWSVPRRSGFTGSDLRERNGCC